MLTKADVQHMMTPCTWTHVAWACVCVCARARHTPAAHHALWKMRGHFAASADVHVSAVNSMVEHAHTPCTYADIKRIFSTRAGEHQPRQPGRLTDTPGQVGRVQQQSCPAAIFMIMAYACMWHTLSLPTVAVNQPGTKLQGFRSATPRTSCRSAQLEAC